MHAPLITIRAKTLPTLLLAAVALGACGGDDDPMDPLAGACQAALDLFPVPVDDATSIFPEVDDSFLEIDFDAGFQFSFFGDSYSSVFLNTNGGMTFMDGNDDFDEAADDILYPGIAVFWGDLDAGDTQAASLRPNQMSYQVCEDRFIVTYTALQDNDEDTWNNTATATLEADGTITVAYGIVLSEDILAGVWDGTHTNDQYVAVQNSYPGYSTNGTGTILFDDWGPGPTHAGELSNRTVVYMP